MFVQHLTVDELVSFLKDEFNYSTISVLKIDRNEAFDMTSLDIKLVNIKKDIFKFKVTFSDFECKMYDLVTNKVIRSLDKEWMAGLLSILRIRETMGRRKVSSAKYLESCNQHKQMLKSKKLSQKSTLKGDSGLKVG